LPADRGRRPRGEIAEVPFGQRRDLLLGHVADDGQAGVGRRIALPVEIHQLGAGEARQVRVVTQGALQRVPCWPPSCPRSWKGG